ncbi:MAG: hypothetical protein FJ291_25225 [Planctomycetes bacterium]|nr:hypothetical protein [Planctomycetota bacterium]
MKYVSISDLRANTAGFRKDLEAERDIVLTANGRAFALMTWVRPDTLEEEVLAIRQAKAQAAINRMRARAKAEGRDKMTMAQIDAIIADIRREKREAKRRRPSTRMSSSHAH